MTAAGTRALVPAAWTASLGPYPDDALTRLLEIRHLELALLAEFAAGRVSGTAHTCLGQEHIPVSLAPHLRDDVVFSNHRGHGHYLALHDDMAGLLAEILGREGAPCRGVGGSQHLHRPGRYMSTGVQGESVPVAVGVALHEKVTTSGRVAAAFIGDGTWGQGAVYEALNMAALWSVPLVLVVEDNGIAQSTRTGDALAGTVAARAAAFGIEHHAFDSDDVTLLTAALDMPVRRAREDPHPVVLEFRTTRLGPHSKGDDTRDPAERAEIASREWAARYADQHPAQYRRVEAAVRARVEAVVTDVTSRPPARWMADSDG